MEFLEKVKTQLKESAEELIDKAKLEKGSVVVVGCSSSEIFGDDMGTNSNPQLGEEVFLTLHEVFSSKGIFIAAQCCEHLNRALILEKDAAAFSEQVNVVPVPKAGGSFATAAYKHLKNPVAVETIKADAGMDIGGVLIGMHLKSVAVPVKLSHKSIGSALLLAARTRPKFIGGVRANYNEDLM